MTDSGVAVPRSAATAMAAPKAMASLGWASMAMGRPSSAPTIWATSGMRDEPPTSRTALMSSDVTPAVRMARRRATIVSEIAGRIIASNSARVSLTSVCRPGSSTGIDTSVSDESASLASMHSWRSRATAAWAVGSSGSGGFEIIGTPEGIERLGGIDFDEAVFAHVRSAIGDALELLDPDEPTSVSAMTRLRQECIDAKEALSGDTDVSIPVLLPNLQTEVRLTRSEFEDMIRPAINETIVALRRAIRSAGVADGDISAVLLVGGSSRIPLVAQMVTAEIGRPVAIDAHPKDAIAFGAAIAVAQQTGQATPESVTTVLPDRTSEVSSPRPPDVVAPGRMPPTPAAPPVVPVAPAAGQPAPGVPGVGQSVPGPGAPGSLVPPAQRPAAALGNAAVAPPPGGPALQATPGAFAPPAGPAGAPPIAARQDQVPEWVGQGATTHMPAVGSPPPSVHVPNPGQGPAPVSPVGGMPAQRPGPYGSPPGGMPPLRPSSSRSSGGSDRTLQVIAVGVVAAMLFIVLVALLVWRNEQKDGQSYTTNLQNDFVTACKTGVQENVCRCAIDKIVDEVPFEDFKAFADLRKEHPDAESPSWLTARVQACQDQLSGATSS